MEQQIYLFIFLCIVLLFVSTGVFIFLKKRNTKLIPEYERHLMELIIREQEKNKRLGQRLEILEEELAKLKLDVKDAMKNSDADKINSDNSFQNNLHYHTFMQKNQELVLLLQNGLSIEKVAKASNRSIREVEMVEAVLKQRPNL